MRSCRGPRGGGLASGMGAPIAAGRRNDVNGGTASMRSIGIRAQPEQYSYVILEGTQSAPVVVDKGICRVPNDASPAERLRWARHDVQEILTRHPVDAAVVKTIESNARMKDPKRLQLEGVLIEGIASHGSQPSTKVVVTNQIKAATGFKNLARYMATLLDNQALKDVSSAAFEDAALSALAGLPRH